MTDACDRGAGRGRDDPSGVSCDESELLAPDAAARDTGGMEPQPERVAPAKPKRRWFQFSLATLLLLTLACAVVLALWAASAERQRRAVEYVEGLGGDVG